MDASVVCVMASCTFSAPHNKVCICGLVSGDV